MTADESEMIHKALAKARDELDLAAAPVTAGERKQLPAMVDAVARAKERAVPAR